VAAGIALRSAVRAGRVKSPKACEIVGCTNARLCANHEDYSQPYMVTWLCAYHHTHLHHVSALPLKTGAMARAPR
jgi:hypothetical protein